MSEEVSERCVILKSLPADIEARDIQTILDTGYGDTPYGGKYEDIHQHIDDKDVTWIVLFKSKEDAAACIENGCWTTNTSVGPVQVVPDLCSMSLIPDKWTLTIPDEKQSSLLDDWVVTSMLKEVPHAQTEEIAQDADDAHAFIKPEDLHPSLEQSEDVEERDAVNKNDNSQTKSTEDNVDTIEHPALEAVTGLKDMNLVKHKADENISSNSIEGIESTNIDIADTHKPPIETFNSKTLIDSEPNNESQEQTTNQNNQDLQNISTCTSYATPVSTAPIPQPIQIPSTLPINQEDMPYDYTSGRQFVTMPHVFDVRHGAPYMYGGQYNPWMPQMAYTQTDAQGAAERPSVVFVPVPVPVQMNKEGQYVQVPVQGGLPYMPNFMYDQQARPMTGNSEIKTDANNLQSDANSTNAFEKEDNADASSSSMNKDKTFQQPPLNTQDEQQERLIMSMMESIEIKKDANNLQSSANSTDAFDNEDDEGLYYSMDKDKTLRPPLLNTQESTVSMDRFGYFKPGAIYDEIDQSTMLSSMLERAGTRNLTRPLPSTPNERQSNENNIYSFSETTSELEILDMSKEADQGFKLAEKEHCKIKIENIPQAVSSATIEMFFENQIQSGGGDISSVDMKSRTGEAIVEFKEEQTVESVLEKQNQVGGFDFCGVKIVVSKYTTSDPSMSFIIPEPLKFPDIDIRLIRFWSNNEPLKKRFEDELKECFGKISWPEPTSDVCLTIHCDVDTKDRQGRYKIEKWTNECGNLVYKNTDLFMMSEKIYIAQEVWTATTERLVDINSKYAQDTTLFLRAEEKSLVVIGTKSEAAQLFGEITSIVTNLEMQLALKNQPITKSRYLKVFELAMVEESKYLEYLKRNNKRYTLDESTGEIEIQGEKKEVDNALKKLEQTLQEYVKKRVSGFCKSAKDLLFERVAQTYIRDALKQKKVVGIWDVVRDEDLVVYSRSDSDLERACQIIRDCITEREIQLDSEMESLVQSQTGKYHILKMTEKYKEQFKIEYERKEIRLACIDVIFDRVYKEIDEFIDLHSVIKEPLKVDPGTLRYIMQLKKRQFEDIERQCNELSVVIETIVTEEMAGFQLSGKKDGVKLAISKLQTIVNTGVFTKDHKLETPGIQQFIVSDEGLHQCKKIETQTNCVLLIDRSFLTEREHTKTQGDGTSSTENTACFDGEADPRGDSIEGKFVDGVHRRALSQEACPIKVEVVLGSLENQTVDVIVNSTNKNIDMNSGAVSKQLLKAGGDALLKDCREKCPPSGLEVCDIIATSGGAMQCSAIFHGILSQWTQNSQESENVLDLFVQNCLKKADKEQFTSIAFPALGTGVLGFPAQVAARIMFDCASTFSGIHLRKVVFVVWSESPETVQAFRDEERKAGQTKTNVTRASSFEKDIITQPTNKPFVKTIGGLTIEIEQGDITKEKTDLIVNSTLKQLDLNSGAVSKAILIAAGDTVQAECKGTQQKMMNAGFVYTSAGRLFSKGIIHVKAKDNAADWEKVVKMVMDFADKKGFNSISFPALGTGGKGCDPAIVAKVMYSAFKSYSRSSSVSHCVKKVRVVIYQQDMVTIFKDAMVENKRRTKRPFSQWFSSKKKEYEEDKCCVVFHIYSDSEDNLNMAQAFLDSLYQEDTLPLETYGKQGLTPAQVEGLKSICDKQLVILCVDEKKWEIKLQGYGKAVEEVKWEIRKALLGK